MTYDIDLDPIARIVTVRVRLPLTIEPIALPLPFGLLKALQEAVQQATPNGGLVRG